MSRVEFDSTKKPLEDLLKKARDGLLQPDKEDLVRLGLLARYEALSSNDAAAENGEKH